MRMKKQRFIALLLMLVMSIAFSVTAFAADYTKPFDSNNISQYLTKYVTNSNGQITADSVLTDIATNYKGNTAVTINGYAMTVSAEGLTKLSVLAKQVYDQESIKVKVNQMNSFDISADTTGAGVMLSGFKGIIQLVVGILAWAVTAGMTLFTALDLCYITMPVLRNNVESQKQSGQGMMVKQDNRTGETRLRWITDEAQFAVNQGALEHGKNPISVYLWKRMAAFVLIAIALYILLTGNINLITGIAINWVSGILQTLGTLGG